MLDIVEEELFQFSDKDIKRVTQITILADEGLVVLLAGNNTTCKMYCIHYYGYVPHVSSFQLLCIVYSLIRPLYKGHLDMSQNDYCHVFSPA